MNTTDKRPVVVFDAHTLLIVMRTTILNKARWMVALCPSRDLKIGTDRDYKSALNQRNSWDINKGLFYDGNS